MLSGLFGDSESTKVHKRIKKSWTTLIHYSFVQAMQILITIRKLRKETFGFSRGLLNEIKQILM